MPPHSDGDRTRGGGHNRTGRGSHPGRMGFCFGLAGGFVMSSERTLDRGDQ